jgi:hypothetical protein
VNYQRLSLLLLLSLLFGLEAFSSSAPPSSNRTSLGVEAGAGGQRRVHWTLDRERSQLWLAQRGALEVYDTTGERLARLVTPDIKRVHALDYDSALDQVRVETDAAVLRFALLAQFGSDGGASRVIRRQS